jgi:hypothetical protein
MWRFAGERSHDLSSFFVVGVIPSARRQWQGGGPNRPQLGSNQPEVEVLVVVLVADFAPESESGRGGCPTVSLRCKETVGAHG